MKTRAYRQQVAEAIVNGVLSYYGVPQGGANRTVTASGQLTQAHRRLRAPQ